MNEAVAVGFFVAGAAFMVLAAIGILRMPDLYTRMSAASKASSLGASLTLAAVAVHFARLDVGLRAVAGVIFVFLTVPVAAHMIGKAAYTAGVPLWRGTLSDELAAMHGRANVPGGVAPPGADEELGPGRRDA